MDQENNSGRRLIIALVVIIILAIVAAIWLSTREPEQPGIQTGTPEELFTAAQEANRTAAIEVSDQFPGNTVYISRTDIPGGGWVVVRKDNNGVPGDVIGATYFGQNERIGSVDLSEPTVESQRYFVQIYTDDGDSAFNIATDALVAGADGAAQNWQFTATRNLPEQKG